MYSIVYIFTNIIDNNFLSDIVCLSFFFMLTEQVLRYSWKFYRTDIIGIQIFFKSAFTSKLAFVPSSYYVLY